MAGYTKSPNALYRKNPMYQYVQINLQENILKSILVHIFLSSLRSKIPPNQHTRYLVSRQNVVRASRNLVDSIIYTMHHLGVRAGTTRNDQQSHRLCLPCGRKFESQVGSLCGRKGGRGGSPHPLRRRFARTSEGLPGGRTTMK